MKYLEFEINNDKEFLKAFEEMEDWNRHGENIEMCCKYLKYDKLAKKMEHINALHDLYGYLIPELGKMRAEIWQEISDDFYKIKKSL